MGERIPELIDAAGSLVSIESVASDAGDMVVTSATGRNIGSPLPPGVPGPVRPVTRCPSHGNATGAAGSSASA